MVLENLQVKHNKFGLGTVTSTSGKYMTVSFETVEKTFVYPDAFEKFLTLGDGSVSQDILADLAAAKSAKEQLIEKKQQEVMYSMTHGIVIPGKEVATDPDEEERASKLVDNEEI